MSTRPRLAKTLTLQTCDCGEVHIILVSPEGERFAEAVLPLDAAELLADSLHEVAAILRARVAAGDVQPDLVH